MKPGNGPTGEEVPGELPSSRTTKLRHEVGLDAMWSGDSPHSDPTWPHSREVVAGHFGGVLPAERDQIVHGNAARLYRLA